MARTLLAVWFVFVETAIHVLADEQQEHVEQDFRTSDAFNDPRYSSTIAAHEGYRLFTNIPGQGLTESLTLTHRDGLYVAGEKVVTESEHRRVVRELQTEHRAVVNALRMEFQNTIASIQPSVCYDPGLERMLYNGTRWVCKCKQGYTGTLCEVCPPIVAASPSTYPQSGASLPFVHNNTGSYLKFTNFHFSVSGRPTNSGYAAWLSGHDNCGDYEQCLEFCKQLCDEHPACSGIFVYQPPSSRCGLKSINENAGAIANVDSYIKRLC